MTFDLTVLCEVTGVQGNIVTLSRRLLSALTLGWLLLLLVPAGLLLSGTSLFPLIALDSPLAELLYWVTTSGTAPYGALTAIVLLGVCFTMVPRRQFIALVLAVGLSMLTTLGLNHFLKPFFGEPRPNAALMAQQSLLQLEEFYQLPAAQRRPMVSQALNQLTNVPSMTTAPEIKLSNKIAAHWQHEVGFSFPSGHTLFAVTLSMVLSYFLLLSGQYLLPLFLGLWSLSMGLSRMLLGMHWSQDVLAATVIGGLMALLCIAIILQFQQKVLPTRATVSNHDAR